MVYRCAVIRIYFFISLCVLYWRYYVVQSLEEKNDEVPRGKGYVYNNTKPSTLGIIPDWDPSGYVFFCLCMGRIGNQVEHFLGAMAFAKNLNRTLILPPFRTYRNVRFTEWFKYEPLAEYHRAIVAEDFMQYLADEHWPKGNRIGYCWLPPDSEEKVCAMKVGNPFGPFWTGLGVDFDSSHIYSIGYYDFDMDKWKTQYPPDQHPVLSFKGAPASFPVQAKHRDLQRYLQFSERIEEEALDFIKSHFNVEKFVGIHLRNGPDWVNACQNAKDVPFYMSSPQCLDGTDKMVTRNLCLPSKSEILRLTKNVILSTRAKVLFVATDKDPMINDLQEHLHKLKVRIFHMDPHLPLVDVAILIHSDHFIGNCVSSFTSIVKRARDLMNKSTSFWGFTAT